jgi:hypothetical protein
VDDLHILQRLLEVDVNSQVDALAVVVLVVVVGIVGHHKLLRRKCCRRTVRGWDTSQSFLFEVVPCVHPGAFACVAAPGDAYGSALWNPVSDSNDDGFSKA